MYVMINTIAILVLFFEFFICGIDEKIYSKPQSKYKEEDWIKIKKENIMKRKKKRKKNWKET